MKDQHEKIKGYRDLSQQEIDLMNKIKTKGQELLELQSMVIELLSYQEASMLDRAYRNEHDAPFYGDDVGHQIKMFKQAEPFRWAAIAKTDIQTGIMALVRSIAQPEI